MTLLPDEVDAAGRHGVGIGVTRGDLRTELIFDASTHKYLGQKQIVVRGPSKGVVDTSSAQLSAVVVDKVGDMP